MICVCVWIYVNGGEYHYDCFSINYLMSFMISLTFVKLIHELIKFFNSVFCIFFINFLWILLNILKCNNFTFLHTHTYIYINRHTQQKEIYKYWKTICFVNLMALILLLFLGMSISYYEVDARSKNLPDMQQSFARSLNLKSILVL